MTAASASAAPIQWFLNEVEFSDGAFATGSFTWDANSQAMTDWSITVSGGNPIAGTEALTSETYLSEGIINISGAFIPGRQGAAESLPSFSILDTRVRHLYLSVQDVLTDVGGTVLLTLGTQDFVSSEHIRFPHSDVGESRLITRGSLVSAVPLPAAIWLLAPAIGGLGLLRRRAV